MAASESRQMGSVFIPEVAPEQAHEAENAVVTKRDADGVALSSVSAARIQAFMLEQAEMRFQRAGQAAQRA